MKMNLLEYLDRTGRHVSRKTFEKYKDKKKSFITWEVLFNIYMKLTDKQKKQIEKDLNGPPENFLLF